MKSILFILFFFIIYSVDAQEVGGTGGVDKPKVKKEKSDNYYYLNFSANVPFGDAVLSPPYNTFNYTRFSWSYYDNMIGLQTGFEFQMGNVFYFSRLKLPDNMAIGLDWTWISHTIMPSSIEGVGTINFLPLTMTLGPQFTYKPMKNINLDFYSKIGATFAIFLSNAGYGYAFVWDTGVNFRYSILTVGISVCAIPETTFTYAYSKMDLSHVKLKLGMNF